MEPFTCLFVRHAVLVDLNRALYALHRRNGLAYTIEASNQPMEMDTVPRPAYPSQMLIGSVNAAWSVVRGNSVFDFSAVAQALSKLFAVRAIAVRSNPHADLRALTMFESGRRVRALCWRAGSYTVDEGTRLPGEPSTSPVRFLDDDFVKLIQSCGVPCDVRTALKRLHASYIAIKDDDNRSSSVSGEELDQLLTGS
ncbi:MAG: hypothetical protein ACOCXJ_00760 [Planctomycetota bacterium]